MDHLSALFCCFDFTVPGDWMLEIKVLQMSCINPSLDHFQRPGFLSCKVWASNLFQMLVYGLGVVIIRPCGGKGAPQQTHAEASLPPEGPDTHGHSVE